MKVSIRHITTLLCALLATVSFQCASLQGTGGTGDETIIGRIMNEDGTPARSTIVTARPFDFDPLSGDARARCVSDTTDADGWYAITLAASRDQHFTLQATHMQERTGALIFGVTLSSPGEAVAVPAATLHRTGSIKTILSDSTIPANGYVYIPGSDLSAYMEDGYAVIEQVPADTIPSVLYNDRTGKNAPYPMGERVNVMPGIQTVIAFGRSAHAAKLTLNTTADGADIMEDVFDFPVLVRLNNQNFTFSEARPDGSDIRFMRADQTVLPFEIERWDAVAQRAEVWVNVDTVHGNDNHQYIVMYWGEPATAIARSTNRVFGASNGFRGVWHLSEEAAGTGTPGLYKDATGVNHGDDFISATDRSGIIGYGHSFDGIDDFIPLPGPVTNFKKADLTISLWVNIQDSGGTILSKLDSTLTWKAGDVCFYFGDGTDAHATGVNKTRPSNGARPSYVGYTDSYVIAAQPVTPGRWHHLAYTWKWNGDTTGTSRYFIDGIAVPLSMDSLLIRVAENARATVRIGYPNNNESVAFFKGSMDELAIASVARSAGWVKLCYMNQREDSPFITLQR